MKKSFHIFQRDLSRLLHNKAAILVLIGVCLLPSLYAWFNIAANLDPYSSASLYFGRWLLYITVGMVQGFIVCIGDVFLTGTVRYVI